MSTHNGHNDPDSPARCRSTDEVGNLGSASRAGPDKVGPVNSLIEGDSEHLDRCLCTDVHDRFRIVGRPGIAHIGMTCK